MFAVIATILIEVVCIYGKLKLFGHFIHQWIINFYILIKEQINIVSLW